MKTILLLTFLLLFLPQKNTFAQCSLDQISFFPKSETLQKNGLIVIEGNGMTQKILNELTFLHAIYLESQSHIVNLRLQEKRSGQVGEVQILLRPENELIVGERYELKVEGLEADEKKTFEREDENGKSYFISWQVVEDGKSEPFVWKENFQFQYCIYEEDEECPSTLYAMFQMDMENPFEVLVKTEVIDLESNKTFTYYLQFEEDHLLVGSGLGDGAVELVENHNYKVRFDIFNTTEKPKGNWSDWVSFKIPDYKPPIDHSHKFGCIPNPLQF